MKNLRDEITIYYQMESPTRDDTIAVFDKIRQLVEAFEEEGLFSLEMALRITEQSRLQARLGDIRAAEMMHRRALIVRRLCIGAEHPFCR
ncbi:hypothetical protein PG993_000853 [Apiospora rasikravindrae]|uniref:Uncharacterized protein n=1 Tax=Apiospora rasikravindrae TaxID=990691 RepID=A0ABR1UBS8_9PEZI